MISIERLEDGTYQGNGSAVANGTVITAENGNMYTVSDQRRRHVHVPSSCSLRP